MNVTVSGQFSLFHSVPQYLNAFKSQAEGKKCLYFLSHVADQKARLCLILTPQAISGGWTCELA